MGKTVQTRLKLRSDTEANWQSSNPVLLRGEAAFSYDVNKLKIGTGVARWSQLEYLHGDYADVFQYGSTAEWNAQPTLVSEKGTMYVYSDYITKKDGTIIPGIKIGDGIKKVVSLPFVNSKDSISVDSEISVNGKTKTLQDLLNAFDEHMSNKDIHTSAEEKAEWNSKVSVYIDQADPDNLRFTTD